MIGMTNAELLEQFTDWLNECQYPAPESAAAAAELLVNWWNGARGGPLADVGEPDIREFLLRWCPRQLTMAPEDAPGMCDELAEFLLFLGLGRRAPGGPAHFRRLARQTLGLSDAMQAAMADPNNWGMAKSMFAGVADADSLTEEELLAAVQQQVDEHNALSLEERHARTDRFFTEGPKLLELPFPYIPPTEAEVTADVAVAALPAKVRALRDYLGENGVPLTAKGNLKLADGRALVELLDTGDDIDPQIGSRVFRTMSTQELRSLMFLVGVARRAGAVRLYRNRLAPVEAWAKRPDVDAAAKLFASVIEPGPLPTDGTGFFNDVYETVNGGVVTWLSRLLEPGSSLEFDAIHEMNKGAIRVQFDDEFIERYVSGTSLERDLSQVLAALVMTGAVHWADRHEQADHWGSPFWTGGSIALTAFGRRVLPEHLEGAGIKLADGPDFANLDARELVDELNSAPSQAHSSILAAWRPDLAPTERAALVAAMAGEATDSFSRIAGIHLLGHFEADVAEPHVRQLLDTEAAGHAAIWLLDRELAEPETVAAFITPAVLVDILSQLVEFPDALCQQFLTAPDPEQLLDYFWHHPAAEAEAVLNVLGRSLPDRRLAKLARTAAMKHRSWSANRESRGQA